LRLLHDLEVFNQVLAVYHIVVISRNHLHTPPTSKDLQANYICHCRKCRTSCNTISKSGMKVFVKTTVLQGGRVPL